MACGIGRNYLFPPSENFNNEHASQTAIFS
jgi:hypothetical protein